MTDERTEAALSTIRQRYERTWAPTATPLTRPLRAQMLLLAEMVLPDDLRAGINAEAAADLAAICVLLLRLIPPGIIEVPGPMSKEEVEALREKVKRGFEAPLVVASHKRRWPWGRQGP